MRAQISTMFLMPALWLAACGGSGAEGEEGSVELRGAPLGQEYLVGYGETILVGGLSLEFIRLDEETRCPINASCVAFWEGNARIHIKVTHGHSSEVIALNTNSSYAVNATVAGYFIELRHLVPEMPYAPTGPLEDYAATLFVARAGP